MNRSRKIDTIALIVLIGFSIAVFQHYILGTYLGYSYPYDTFLFRPDNRFMDFFNMMVSPYRDGRLHTVQFPFGQRLAQSFSLLPGYAGFALFIAILVSFIVYVNYSNLKGDTGEQTVRNVFVFSFLTYPFLFLFDRANVCELFVFIFLYLFLRLHREGRSMPGALFLACAISMKLFPAVFLVLLVSDRKIKETVFVVVMTAVITLGAYLSYDGDLLQNIGDHLALLGYYGSVYSTGNEGLYFGHSLWGLVKIVAIAAGHRPHIASISRFYPATVFILFGLVSLGILFKEKSLWKKVALLVFSMNLFPYVSADYKLIHVLLPLFLFVNSGDGERRDMRYAVLFGLLLIPKAYIHYAGEREISTSIFLGPLLMLIFMTVILQEGLGARVREIPESLRRWRRAARNAG